MPSNNLEHPSRLSAVAAELPLSTLLSQVLVAFTIEFDNEFERQMPHRTTNHGPVTGSRYGPWLESLVMWANCMQFVSEEGVSVDELEDLARTKTNLNGMERWGYIAVEPKPGDSRSKPSRSESVIRATFKGRKAQDVWRPLFEVIEKRWQARFGDGRIGQLRKSLWMPISQIKVDLPDCLPILGYGLFSRGPERERREPVAREDGDGSHLPLSALLSRLPLAFAIEFESESDLSLAIGANVLRVLDEKGVRVRGLPLLAGVSKESVSMAMGVLQKKGIAVIEPDQTGSRAKIVRLTPKGREAQDAYRQLLGIIDERWQSRFGTAAIRQLRDSLEWLVGDASAQRSPLFGGLEPHAGGWRASVRKPNALPHYPMVLHRGGFPDGSLTGQIARQQPVSQPAHAGVRATVVLSPLSRTMKPLRIAINALYLLPGGVGGTEIYLRQLLGALAAIDDRNEYLIFTNRETGSDLAPGSPRFRHLPQPVQAEIRPLRILYEQSSLPSIIEREHVDLVFNPGFTAPKFSSIPSVTVFHDLQHVHHPEYFRKRELPFWNLLLAQAVRSSARIIAVSPSTRRDVIEHYHLAEDRVVAIPHGVERKFFQLERRPDSDHPFLLCVATLDPNKNLETLVRVYAGLRGEFPNLRLVLAGMRGAQTAKIEAMVDEMHLRPWVRMTGWIPRSEIFELYERATAFVYPSTFEGFGLPVLEAMAAGVPLACSRIDPLLEVAGDAAFFFDPASDQEMAQAIFHLLTEREQQAEQIERGKIRASGFRWEESARRTLAVFEEVSQIVMEKSTIG